MKSCEGLGQTSKIFPSQWHNSEIGWRQGQVGREQRVQRPFARQQGAVKIMKWEIIKRYKAKR